MGPVHNRRMLLDPLWIELAASLARESEFVREGEFTANRSYIVLIALDDAANTVLSFGRIADPVTWGSEEVWNDKTVATDLPQERVLSGGILLCQDDEFQCLFPQSTANKAASLTREVKSWPSATAGPGILKIEWAL